MPDYENMYHNLFNRITDAIEILKLAQAEAERSYISSASEIIEFNSKECNRQ